MKRIDYGEIKLRLLLEGMRFDTSVLMLHSEYQNKRYYYGRSDEKLLGDIRPPQEIMLNEGKVVVGVTQRSTSQWFVSWSNEHEDFFLYYGDEPITRVYIPTMPKFYSQKVEGETLASEIVSMYGGYILAGFVKGHCDFFKIGKECQFCSLNPTRCETNDGVTLIDAQQFQHASELAFKLDDDRISCIMLCGGSYFDRNFEIENYVKLFSSLNKGSINPKVHQHLLAAPPTDYDLFYSLKESGVDSMGMSLEIFDPDLFNIICPGKAKYIGYDHYLRSFEKAVEVFGRGRVFSVFVGGLEPIESLCEGFDLLTKMGVVPSVNIFHPNPNSKLEHKAPPTYEYIAEMCSHLGPLYRQYDYIPAVCGFNRNSLDAECANGFGSNRTSISAAFGRNPGRQKSRKIEKDWDCFRPAKDIFVKKPSFEEAYHVGTI